MTAFKVLKLLPQLSVPEYSSLFGYNYELFVYNTYNCYFFSIGILLVFTKMLSFTRFAFFIITEATNYFIFNVNLFK